MYINSSGFAIHGSDVAIVRMPLLAAANASRGKVYYAPQVYSRPRLTASEFTAVVLGKCGNCRGRQRNADRQTLDGLRNGYCREHRSSCKFDKLEVAFQ